MDKVKDELNVIMNYYNLEDHVTEMDRNNRTVKEIYHAQYHKTYFL